MTKKNKAINLDIIKLIPHSLTIGALCMGLYGVRLAIINNYIMACVCVLFACFLDGIDGRVARKLNAASDFGAQLDSLADFFNFGVAPGFIMYFWKMDEYLKFKTIGWLPVLVLSMCMAIRLARFNVNLNSGDNNNPLKKYFFQGIPAPMAALLVMLPMIMSFEFDIPFLDMPIVSIINTIVISILAGSTIPTPCFKKMKINPQYKYPLLLCLGTLIIFIIVKPWLTITYIAFLYILSIAISWFFYYKFKKEADSNLIKTAENAGYKRSKKDTLINKTRSSSKNVK